MRFGAPPAAAAMASRHESRVIITAPTRDHRVRSRRLHQSRWHHLLHLPQPRYLHFSSAALGCWSSAASASASGVFVSLLGPVALAGPSCTAMRLGSGLGVGSALGRVMISTPLSREALMSSSLMSSGSVKEREKETWLVYLAACGVAQWRENSVCAESMLCTVRPQLLDHTTGARLVRCIHISNACKWTLMHE